MNQIQIELNRSEFAGGETVSGEVTLELAQDTPVRGIRLHFQGYEKSSWREGSGKHRHTHSEKRDYFDQEITLVGRPRLGLGALAVDSFRGIFSQENYEVIRAGSYRYPFSYVLPPDLPGDYDSALTGSRIYYALKAQVDLPLKFDLEALQPLVIHESAPVPPGQAITQRRTKHFLFDSDSLIEAALHLDTDTWPVGATLPCQIEVMNRAPGKEIRAVTLALNQIETLQAHGHSHVQRTEVGHVRFDQCRFPLKDCTTLDLCHEIPADLYPTSTRGTLVKIGYELQATLHIPWAVDAKLSVPLTLVGRSQ